MYDAVRRIEKQVRRPTLTRATWQAFENANKYNGCAERNLRRRPAAGNDGKRRGFHDGCNGNPEENRQECQREVQKGNGGRNQQRPDDVQQTVFPLN